jgi:DNA-dependent RNA polymerase auxiliary subunit epsilon
MKVISSTDNKYLGMEVPEIKIGDIVELDGYQFEVQFIHQLSNGHVCFGNPNYQFEISQE